MRRPPIRYSGIKNRISAGKILTLLAGGIALAGIQLFCGTVSNVLWLIGMAAAVFVMGFVLKYGGYVKINVLDHWFRVEILIPHQL
jgi:hypothetical protein